jgi:hypothetical protein
MDSRFPPARKVEVPAALYRKLAEAATTANRSTQGHARHLLERGLRMDEELALRSATQRRLERPGGQS